MTIHLTVRMAWHDNAWNGNVCLDPSANAYCVGSHSLLSDRLARTRDLEQEVVMAQSAPKGDSQYERGYLPPCFWSLNARSSASLKIRHIHPLYPKKVAPIEETLPPESVMTWPFRLSFNRDKDSKKNGQYRPDIERLLDRFLKDLEADESVVFLYCNYDNPVSADDSQYLLVGFAPLRAAVSKPPHFAFDAKVLATIRSREGMQNFPDRNWAITVPLDLSKHGVLLPYHEYLAAGCKDPSLIAKLDEMKCVIDEDSLQSSFKYVASDLNDDRCIYLLYKIRRSLLIGLDQRVVSFDFNESLRRVDSILAKAWERRGRFPGLAPMLTALTDNASASHGLIKQLVKRSTDNLPTAVYELATRPNALPADLDPFDGYLSELGLELANKKKLWSTIERLALIGLTNTQARRILNNEVMAADGRALSPHQIADNPYLLCEYYISEGNDEDPENDDPPIDLFKIDVAMFPDTKFARRDRKLQALPPDSPERLRPLLLDHLDLVAQRGHCYAFATDVLDYIREYPLFYKRELIIESDLIEKPTEAFLAHLAERIEVRHVDARPYYYAKSVANAERLVARVLEKLSKQQVKEPSDVRALFEPALRSSAAKFTNEVEGFDPTLFVEERLALFDMALKQRLVVISGRPGSGKSHAAGQLVEILRERNQSILLLAPTGKAALSLQKKTSVEVRTIDRFLSDLKCYGLLDNPETLSSAARVEGVSFQNVILDESSMIDLNRLAALLHVVVTSNPTLERLILVGDEHQLPPIGLGRPFVDLIRHVNRDSAYLAPNYVRLRVNCRQEGDADMLRIADVFADQAAHYEPLVQRLVAQRQVSKNLIVESWTSRAELEAKVLACFEELWQSEFAAANPGTVESDKKLNAIFGLYDSGFVNNKNFKFVENLHLDRFQVLTPYRADHFGTLGLNDTLRTKLRDSKHGWSKGFRHSDKVIRTKNWYRWNSKERKRVLALSNGSIGVVNGGEFKKKWFFPEHPYPMEKIDDVDLFELAYAITVHKAQGSEFRHVFLVVPKKAALLTRELIYTGMTRAKAKLFLFVEGDDDSVLNAAVSRSAVLPRRTSLFEDPSNTRTEHDYEPAPGVRVKSRAEYILHTALQRFRDKGRLTFDYELRLPLPGKSFSIRPDFTVVTAGGKRYFLEHLGMVTVRRYVEDWQERVRLYKEFGLFEALITTDDLQGINGSRIDALLDDIVNDRVVRQTDGVFSGAHYRLY